MSELPTRNPSEVLNAIEARVRIAKAKDEPCDVVLVREWECLIAWFECPDLGRRPHWTRVANGFAFKGVPILPVRQGDVDDSQWIGIGRKV